MFPRRAYTMTSHGRHEAERFDIIVWKVEQPISSSRFVLADFPKHGGCVMMLFGVKMIKWCVTQAVIIMPGSRLGSSIVIIIGLI